MIKIAMALLLLCALVLFLPRYNLYERDGSWTVRYVLREKGFWLQENCVKAGRRLDNPYRCMTSSTWEDLWGKQVEIKE